jgi:hypothetical protein
VILPDSLQILALPMDKNDSGATTIRGYLVALLMQVWEQSDSFSGKRPFGNSSWKYELYAALVKAEFVKGIFDEDGYIEDVDTKAANHLIIQGVLSLEKEL